MRLIRDGWKGVWWWGKREIIYLSLYMYTVTTRMTSALRWAIPNQRAIFIYNCEGQSHKTVSTDHNFWREGTAEAESNRGPSAYQLNALPLGQTGSRKTVSTDDSFRRGANKPLHRCAASSRPSCTGDVVLPVCEGDFPWVPLRSVKRQQADTATGSDPAVFSVCRRRKLAVCNRL